MYTYTYRHRVRYRECDPMGVVYHVHYLDYFEFARTEALRSLGIAYKELEDQGIMMPVIDLAVHYRGSAYYDDLLDIEVRFEALPTVRVPIHYTVRRAGEERTLATGHVTLCFVDTEQRRPMRPPAAIRHLFEAAFNHVPSTREPLNT